MDIRKYTDNKKKGSIDRDELAPGTYKYGVYAYKNYNGEKIVGSCKAAVVTIK